MVIKRSAIWPFFYALHSTILLPFCYIIVELKVKQEIKLDIAPLESWWPSIQAPFLISGPCSAETEDQVLQTALRLKRTNLVHILRAGIWKPRTRPNSFEGVGEIGLSWLKKAKEQTGLPTTVEVATAQHVELALKYDVDILWIGARTTVNPFSVQEIADALKGVDIPVMVKNPINPDVQLWIGAIERINNVGIKKIAAIHRGFSFLGESVYRNKPMWEIPIALKTLHPEIPIICDPSHISGRRDLLLSVAQKALDLGMAGLMLESHITPDEAWSDAKQQVTPERLAEIIQELAIRNNTPPQDIVDDDLLSLRKKIDQIDEKIIELLAQRMKIAEAIGEYKKEKNITILQVDRWKDIMKTRSEWAKELNLSEEFTMKYLEQLHKESIRTQTRVMNNKTT